MNPQTAIVGIGQTEYSRASGRSELQLACEAVTAAVKDAGLSIRDVDGLVTMTRDSNDELALMRSLGMEKLHWSSRTPFGGGGAAAMVQHAAAAVASGAADTVVVYRALNGRSENRLGGAITSMPPGLSWYIPYGLDTAMKMYGLWFQRYMHKWGATNQDFGRYTVAARDYASRNPASTFFQRPITLDDHQNSRWIVEPIIRLLDCCQESDGAAAVVVTSRERARDLPSKPAVIQGSALGEVRDGDILFNYYHQDTSTFPQAEAAAARLWRTSGLTPGDMDAAMLYENFSPVVFYQLEAYGFCPPGQAKDFIAAGHISPGGSLPVNTHGGLLGEAYIHGLNSVVEAVRQVRGTSHNQIPKADHVLCSSGHSAVIVGQDR